MQAQFGRRQKEVSVCIQELKVSFGKTKKCALFLMMRIPDALSFDFSSPQYPGVLLLALPYACFDLGWDEKRFKKALQELLQIGRIKYDAHAHVVLVQNYIKHNPLENPNQVKSAIERLEEIPQTQLFQDF